MQLAYDLSQIPTLEFVEFNTDAIMYEIDSNYQNQAHKVLQDWQDLTGLELEEDKIVKLVMRDVNSYAEITNPSDNYYEVHYKGGELTRGEHIFTWNKEKKVFEYSFNDSLKSNSLSIVSEALLKKLLFDIPLEDTINKCNDIFRFQIISHLGSTYEKCVQESEDGDIELQRNNRIYAGKKPSGVIIKVKPDGRRDSLANCPPNPVVDNGNQLTINDIDKEWYIEFTTQKYNDFIGIPRLESYKKTELIDMTSNLGLNIDKKIKKSELIKLIKEKRKGDNNMATKQELEERLAKALDQNKELVKQLEEKGNMEKDSLDTIYNNLETNPNVYGQILGKARLHEKIDKLRQMIRSTNFVFDKMLPSNLGGGEYHSTGQYYNAIQDYVVKLGLDFKFETLNLVNFEKACTIPTNGLPIHIATVQVKITLTDIETDAKEEYYEMAQGSDTIDKAVSGAETMAFRQWFTKNFTPKTDRDIDFDLADDVVHSEPPKVKPYIPEDEKQKITKEVVKEKQQEKSDDEDIKAISENIMLIREKSGNEHYGENTLKKLMSGELSSPDILEIDLIVKNKLDEVLGLNG